MLWGEGAGLIWSSKWPDQAWKDHLVRAEWKVRFYVTPPWHRPIHLPPTLRNPGGHLFHYAELYQMWQLQSNKVGVLNKCFLSAGFTRGLNRRLSPWSNFSLRFPRCLLFHHSWRSKLSVRGHRDANFTGDSSAATRNDQRGLITCHITMKVSHKSRNITPTCTWIRAYFRR